MAGACAAACSLARPAVRLRCRGDTYAFQKGVTAFVEASCFAVLRGWLSGLLSTFAPHGAVVCYNGLFFIFFENFFVVSVRNALGRAHF